MHPRSSIVVAASTLAALSAFAAVPATALAVWTPLGPSCGEVRQIRFHPTDPSLAYAGTSGGVFASADGGTSWRASSAGLPGGLVSALAISPADPLRLWASVTRYPVSFGVSRSTDGGAMWVAASQGLEGFSTAELAPHPSDPLRVLAATDGGLFASSDGGATWTPAGLAGLDVGAVAFHPQRPSTIYAGVDFDGPYRSDDGGLTWTKAATGYSGDALFYDLDPVPSAGDWVFTCGWDAWRTTDAMQAWTPLTGGLPGFVITQSLSTLWPAGDSLPSVYLADLSGGVYRSRDGGANFTNVAPSLPGPLIEYEAVDQADVQPSRVLIGALGGEVFRSDDGGDTWAGATRGLAQGSASSVAGRGALVVAGTLRGIYVSADRGQHWGYSNVIADIGATINHVTLDSRGTRGFAVTTDAFFEGAVLRATAVDWRRWDSVHHTDGPATGVAVDPVHPDTVYAGYTWDILPGKIAVSYDGGTTWVERAVGQRGVQCTYVLPGGSGRAFAGTDNGLLRSDDTGATWVGSGLAGFTVLDLAAVGTTPQVVAAATLAHGVWRSDDGGMTWTDWSSGLPELNVRAVDGLAVGGGALFAGCASQGVWVRPLDGSQPWQPYTGADQPASRAIRDLTLLPGGGGGGRPALLAATDGASVWSATLGRSSEAEGLAEVPVTTSSLATSRVTVGPNPLTRDAARVRWSAAAGAQARLVVYDIEGRVVGSVDARTSASGTGTLEWHARDAAGRTLPAGVYPYHVLIGGEAFRGRLTVLR